MKLRELLDAYDQWGKEIVINNDNLERITKDMPKAIMGKPILSEMEVVSFGFYDDELCVRITGMCEYHLEIPTVGLCCDAYYNSKRKDGRTWMHFPFCSEESCPLKHPELLKGATLKSE